MVSVKVKLLEKTKNIRIDGLNHELTLGVVEGDPLKDVIGHYKCLVSDSANTAFPQIEVGAVYLMEFTKIATAKEAEPVNG